MLSPYEVLELEKKWEAYSKSKKPYPFEQNKNHFSGFKSFKNLFILLIVFVIVGLVFVFYKSDNKVAKHEVEKLAAISKQKFKNPSEKEDNKKLLQELESLKVELEKEKMKTKLQTSDITIKNKDETIVGDINYSLRLEKELAPKSIFLKKIADDDGVQKPILNKENDDVVKESVKETGSKKDNISINVVSKNEVKTDNIQNKATIVVSDATFEIDLEIENFNKRPSFGSALKIAKFYFDKEDYANSRVWAIRSNSLDKNSEDSWILFAKSSYKLGNKEEAVKALRDYLKFSDSKKAIDTLRLIEQNGL